MKRMTQRELARRLKLGEKTVSLGLAGHPGVAKETSEYVREMASAYGMDVPPLPHRTITHEVRPPRVGLDDEIRAEGQPMGRFVWNGEDWLPDPNGTHDGFIWRLGFYTLPHQDDLEQRLTADRAHLAQWRDTPDYQATVARITGQAS